MHLVSRDLQHNMPMHPRFAFGKAGNPFHFSDNINPHLQWNSFPKETRSFALSCIDVNVPIDLDDINKVGKKIAIDFPRKNFVHWLMINIPIHITSIETGSCRQGIKLQSSHAPGIEGENDYSMFDEKKHIGYDGPCPPWNDPLIHNYHFHIYALDVELFSLKSGFQSSIFQSIIAQHTIDESILIVTYTLFNAINY